MGSGVQTDLAFSWPNKMFNNLFHIFMLIYDVARIVDTIPSQLQGKAARTNIAVTAFGNIIYIMGCKSLNMQQELGYLWCRTFLSSE